MSGKAFEQVGPETSKRDTPRIEIRHSRRGVHRTTAANIQESNVGSVVKVYIHLIAFILFSLLSLPKALFASPDFNSCCDTDISARIHSRVMATLQYN
jgi:hypothetical protein